jgi:dynein assembly factor 5
VPALTQALVNVGGALTHRHAAVRAAGVAALDALVHARPQPDEMVPLVVPAARALAHDSAQSVRLALLQATTSWLARPAVVPDADAPHFTALLLLNCMDDSPEVAQAALEALDHAARQRLSNLHEEEQGRSRIAVAAQQSPFSRRPCAASRALVTSQLKVLIPAAIADLKGWSPALRAAGAKVLLACVTAAEGGAEDALGAVIPALIHTVSDEDPQHATRVLAIAHVLGTHTQPALWLPLATETVAGGQAVLPGRRTNALVILSALLRSCAQPLTPADVQLCVRAITCGAIMEAATQHAALRLQAAVAAGTLVQAVMAHGVPDYATSLAPSAQALFAALLALRTQVALHGLGDEGDAQQLPQADGATSGDPASDVADLALGRLDEATGGALYASQAGALLQSLSAEASTWRNPQAPGFLALCALMRTAPPHALEPHAVLLAHTCAECCNSSLKGPVTDLDSGALSLSALRSLDSLLESAQHAAALSSALPALLRDTLTPHLVWRAGRTAAATRYAALVACGTLLRSGALPTSQVEHVLQTTTLVASLGACLDDDYYVDMRLGAAHVLDLCIRACGPAMSRAHRLQVFQDLSKRLDDSRDEVRIAAAQVLASCLTWAVSHVITRSRDGATALPGDADETEAWVSVHLPRLLAALMVHMDDDHPAVREAASHAAIAAAQLVPEEAARVVTAAQANARHGDAYAFVLQHRCVHAPLLSRLGLWRTCASG